MIGEKTKLQTISLFDGIPEAEAIRELESMGTGISEYEKNTCIIREGDRNDLFGVVISGTVRVEQTDSSGNRNIITNVSKGQLFGASAVLSGSEFSHGVYANEDCRVILLRRNIIYAPCGGSKFHHRFILNTLRCIAESNIRLSDKIEVLSKRTIRERLMTFLSLEAERTGQREFDVSFDRQGLADFLCVERSALSAEIGKMCRDGLIDARRSHFRLL